MLRPEPNQLSQRLTLLAACLIQFLGTLDYYAVNLAIPRMASDLNASTTSLQWLISGYQIVLGAFMIAAGRLGDIWGRRRVLLVGVLLFGASSLACGFASTPAPLIMLRLLQGLGTAIMFPLALAIVTNAYPAHRLRRALGIVYMVSATGTAVGPFIGGLLTETLGWRWIFFINIPIVLLIITLILRGVRESRDEETPPRIDIRGLVAISAGLAILSYAIDRGPDWGWRSPLSMGMLILGGGLIAAFFFIEKYVRWPLVNLNLLRNRAYVVITLGGAAANMLYVTIIFIVGLYLQDVRHLDPLTAGVVFLALSVGAATSSQMAGRTGNLSPRCVLSAALFCGGLGTILMSYYTAWPTFIPAFTLAGFGVGLGWAYAGVGTQAVVAPERAGEAGGVTLTVLIAGGGVAIAAAAAGIGDVAQATNAGHAMLMVLRVGGIGNLVAAALVLLFGKVPVSARQQVD